MLIKQNYAQELTIFSIKVLGKNYCLLINFKRHILVNLVNIYNYLQISMTFRAITESGYNYLDEDSLINSNDVLMKLAESSPFKYVHKVQAPTLFLFGKNDLRVPPSQGLAYYHLLKKHGVITK